MEDTAANSPKTVNIPNDLIRTLAIVLVIVLHASNETLQAASVSATYWWTAAFYKSISLSCVPLFVMVSGALLLQPSKLHEPIRVFLKKRLSRIGLAFAFWSVIYLIWSWYIYSIPLTLESIEIGTVRTLFTGAYYQFWFLYLIFGLYLITPILRAVMAYGSQRLIRYLILLWFAGVAILPIIQLPIQVNFGVTLNSGVFLIGGMIGYFVLGSYLQTIKVRSSILVGLMALAFVWTIAGMWLMNNPLLYLGQPYFFFDYVAANVIVGSAALFLLLLKARPDWPSSKPTFAKRIVQSISKNTLPIFLLHVLILEFFERGFFGFTLAYTTLNPIVEIPLITALTFFITYGLVLLMRQVPVLKKLIG